MAFADIQKLVDQLVSNQDQTVKPAQRDSAISRAVLAYGQDIPRTRVADLTFAAAGYSLAVPSDWLETSNLIQTEYPIAQRPISTIEMAVYRNLSGYELLAQDEMPLGAVVRVTYTTSHQLAEDGSADTIPAAHQHALACLAGHFICLELATYFSADREPTINADVAQGQTRAQAYAARSRDLRGQYYAAIGKADPLARTGGSAGSGASGAQSTSAAAVASWAGRDRLVRHNAWWNEGSL